MSTQPQARFTPAISIRPLGEPQPGATVGVHGLPRQLEARSASSARPPLTIPARSPASAEMKHDAVLWSNGLPTAASAVPRTAPSVTWLPRRACRHLGDRSGWSDPGSLPCALDEGTPAAAPLLCRLPRQLTAERRPDVGQLRHGGGPGVDHTRGPAVNDCVSCT